MGVTLDELCLLGHKDEHRPLIFGSKLVREF